MNEVFIHVGLQKTGTTFIQEEIFRKMNVRYIRDITFTNLCFPRDRKTIIANEALSGDPYSMIDNRFLIADNLKKLFPNAKIIVGHRDAKGMFKSLYSQGIRNGATSKIFIHPDYVHHQMEYIEYIKSLFKDVFVYYYDTDLKGNKHDFVERLCEFIGEPVPDYKDKRYRISLKPYQMKAVGKINRLFYHPLFNPDGKLPEILGRATREMINLVSNSRMQKMEVKR